MMLFLRESLPHDRRWKCDLTYCIAEHVSEHFQSFSIATNHAITTIVIVRPAFTTTLSRYSFDFETVILPPAMNRQVSFFLRYHYDLAVKTKNTWVMNDARAREGLVFTNLRYKCLGDARCLS